MSEKYKNSYIAESAVLIGDITLGKDASVWHNVTIRADRDTVEIGDGSNVQDNCVIHMDTGCPVKIGKNVTIGHAAIVHGAVVGDGTTIGMGAILMNRCVVGQDCIIGAGALITQNVHIPDRSLVIGSPAKVVREVTDEELASMRKNNESYIKEARELRE